jgi:hypothetical protein
MQTLIFALVRSKNRRTLLSMRELRQRLLKELQSSPGPFRRDAINLVQDDLRAIDLGLKQLA